MKKLSLSVAFMALLLASCSKYQINTLSSTNTIKDKQTGNFVMENDSVKITYSFYGSNAPIALQVYNKLNKPLYIDWEQSALIVNDQAMSYAGKNVSISGATSTTTYKWDKNLSSSNGSINAVAKLPENVAFIPPHSQISHDLLNASPGILPITDDLLHEANLSVADKTQGYDSVKVKTAAFTPETSPLKMKSYLTLYIADGISIIPIAYQQEFYISNLVSTTLNPSKFEVFHNQRGDYYYSSKKTGYGKVVTGVGAAAAIGVAAATITDNKER